jgi:hypothetical protein
MIIFREIKAANSSSIGAANYDTILLLDYQRKSLRIIASSSGRVCKGSGAAKHLIERVKVLQWDWQTAITGGRKPTGQTHPA